MNAVNKIKDTDEKREKRAMSLSASGLVNRVGGRFEVSTPIIRGKQNIFEVWRDNKGKIRCNCSEFVEHITTDTKFRCEHILAVKFAVATKNSESVTKQNTAKANNVVSMDFVHELRNSNQKQNKNDNLIADILDESSPNWSYSVKNLQQNGNVVSITVGITVDGVMREGLGSGIDVIAAENAAFKQSALKFGFVRNAWNVENYQKNEVKFDENPIATCLSDLISTKQLSMIRAISRESKIDADVECRKILSCKTDELSKNAASFFINCLQMQKSNQPTNVVPIRMAS